MGAKVRSVAGKWYVFVTHRGRRKARQFASNARAIDLAKKINQALLMADGYPGGLGAMLRDTDTSPIEPHALPSLNRTLAGIDKGIKEYPLGYLSPCVYFLCLDDEVVYVGRTVSLGKRIATHNEDKSKLFDRVFYLPTAENDLESEESKFISSLKPKFNRTGIRESAAKSSPGILHRDLPDDIDAARESDGASPNSILLDD